MQLLSPGHSDKVPCMQEGAWRYSGLGKGSQVVHCSRLNCCLWGSKGSLNKGIGEKCYSLGLTASTPPF